MKKTAAGNHPGKIFGGIILPGEIGGCQLTGNGLPVMIRTDLIPNPHYS